MLQDLRFRLRAIFQKRAMEMELNDELRFHVENEVEKYKRAGMSDEQAQRRARLAFGGDDQIKGDCREARGINFVETIVEDIRYSFRAARRNPGFFGIAALTLALGIGASIAVFSLVNTILLKPLPYPNSNAIMVLWRTGPVAALGDVPWTPSEYKALLQADRDVFQDIGAFKKDTFNLTGVSKPELIEGVQASASLFPMLGISPLMGRTFTPDENQKGHDHVVILSNRLWQSRFGADAHIVGKSIDLSGSPYTVIGVMPASFGFPNQDGIPSVLDLPKETQLWVPLTITIAPGAPNEIGVIGRLKPKDTFARAEQNLQTAERRIDELIPQEKGWSSRAVPLSRQVVSDSQRPLLLLLGAVSVVLLIACANVAGLTLNRSLGRRRELVLRGALGARRGRVVRQLLTESLVLAIAGGCLGILFGEAGLNLAKHFGPQSIPHLHDAGLDLRVMVYALGITLLAGLLFGLAPAIGATRMSMVEALKEGGQRTAGNASAPRLRNALLIAQIAMALALVIAAGLLVRTFSSMLHSDPGFAAEHVVTFELPLPVSKYADRGQMAQLYKRVLDRLQSLPGVESAGLNSIVPMAGATDGTAIRLPQHPAFRRSDQPFANYSFASPQYFATIGTPLLRGRDFTDADTLTAVPVTIISSSMARKYFHGQDPIGKQVGVALTTVPVRTIIGVVADIKHTSLRETPDPEMFVPYTQSEMKVWPSMQSMQFAIRTKTDPAAMMESVRQAVSAIDPDLPVAKFATLATLVDLSITTDRFSMILVGSFGILALILAAVGMYGVISYSVMQRTPEIGVRIALGAQRSEIFAMVLRQAGQLVAAGIVIGLLAALAATRLMTRFLYGVQPADPLTFATVAGLLALVAFLACYVPARRAIKIEPVIALRHE